VPLSANKSHSVTDSQVGIERLPDTVCNGGSSPSYWSAAIRLERLRWLAFRCGL